MKILLAYVLSLGLILGGAFLAIQSALTRLPISAADAKPAAATPAKPAIMAKSDKSDEPVVDMNDPDLFDARGQFPAAMREAMAKAKRESVRDFSAVRAEHIKAAQDRKNARRRAQRHNSPPMDALAYGDMPRASYEPPRRQESWNTGGFGFGF